MSTSIFPKFSIRNMMLLMVFVGLIATFMAGASRGSLIGLGLATSMIAVAIPFLFFTCAYWIGLAIGTAVGRPSSIEPSAEGVPLVSTSSSVEATGGQNE